MRRSIRAVLGAIGTVIVSAAHSLLLFMILISLLAVWAIDLTPVYQVIDTQLVSQFSQIQTPQPWRIALLVLPFFLLDLFGVFLAKRSLPTVVTCLVFAPLAGLFVAYMGEGGLDSDIELESILVVLIVFGLYALRLFYARFVHR